MSEKITRENRELNHGNRSFPGLISFYFVEKLKLYN